ncbi:uncharacterized protein [Physcomitrium patens]|uniref:uncharacterized protein n=1 Tax=Physcomitrium patens TaxID=3218 RepID=UPI003CCD5296
MGRSNGRGISNRRRIVEAANCFMIWLNDASSHQKNQHITLRILSKFPQSEPAPFFAIFAARLCICVVVGSVTLEESVATSISFESVRSLSIADSHCGHLQLDLLSLLDPGSVDPENPIAGRRLSSLSFSHSVSLSHSGFEFLGVLELVAVDRRHQRTSSCRRNPLAALCALLILDTGQTHLYQLSQFTFILCVCRN